jgi:hypothetical protein
MGGFRSHFIRVAVPVFVVAACAISAASAAGETRTPAQWPFKASSPWNSAIGTGAQFTSPTCDSAVQAEAGDSLVPWVNTTQWSIPVYNASSLDPSETIYQSNDPGTATPHGYNWGSYHVPETAKQDPGGDRNLALIEPSGNFSDETWLTYLYPAWVNAGDFARHDLVNGDGFVPLAGFGPRAGDSSTLGGLIRTWELQAGSIRHALAMALTGQRESKTWVPPASSTDSDTSGHTGTIPMGQLVAIPSSTSIDSLGLTTTAGRMIATALQNYGAYDMDTGGTLAFYAEPGADSLVNPARAVTNGTSDLMRIVRSLRCVSNNQAPTWGGGGTPLAPPPPPFG